MDFKVDSATQTVTVVLRNGMGFDANPLTIAATGCTPAAPITAPLPNGQQLQYDITGCTLTSGSKYSGDLTVTYTNSDTGIVHNVK